MTSLQCLLYTKSQETDSVFDADEASWDRQRCVRDRDDVPEIGRDVPPVGSLVVVCMSLAFHITSQYSVVN